LVGMAVDRYTCTFKQPKIKESTAKTKDNQEKANNTKHSKTKLAWFSRLIRHSAKKQGGLILQSS